ncbi:MAG: PIN domain-containing protein [Phycisphaerales bacterium]|nr:PIN domain-containing protein [Phycisphaerales bacterium]
MLTIDASVWVNADSPAEAHSETSRTFLNRIAESGDTVILPTLLRVEVAGAISRVRKDRALGFEYSRALAALPFVRWIALDAPVAIHASALAAEHGLRGADAVYAAVAVIHGCTLISLDHEHLTRLTPILKVWSPSQWLAQGEGAVG